MASQWIQPAACRNLAVLIEAVTAPMLIEHPAPVCLEMDVDVNIPIPCDQEKTAELIVALSGQALKAMPDGGDLTITACETQKGIELEIADSGEDFHDRQRTLPISAAAIKADLSWLDCPQGGVAVTITFPVDRAGEQSNGRVAA